MNAEPYRMMPWGNLRNWVLAVLLGLASIHCVQSIFLANVSFIDLQSYSNGTEKMPYQGRVAMIPVGRWAEDSRAMRKAANWMKLRVFSGRQFAAEPPTPEKVAFLIVASCMTLLATAFVARSGWQMMPSAWWLPPALFLYMLYTTYGARAGAQFWYPYDLPHFALFGVAAICILRGFWAAAFCLFLVDLPMRETSVYLVPLMLAMGYARKQRQVIPWSLAMLVLWAFVRWSIARHFAGNESETRSHWEFWLWGLHNPYRWPQLASVFGFLLVPFIWGWKYLSREERIFVFAALPGVAITSAYGVPFETRIYDEWLAPMAILLSLQVTRALAQRFSQTEASAPRLASSQPAAQLL